MAAVAAIAETTVNANNEEQLVTMIVDKQLFGIPILQVQDIVEATKITAVPLSPSAIGGLLNLRGRIVTVIDLRKLLGNDEEEPWASQMGVTVEHKGDLYTLLVDAIGDVRSVRRGDFDKAPSTLAPETRRLCSGIYRLQGNLLVVLEVSRILTPEVIGSTSVLTVAERKARKAAALDAGQGGKGHARQISSHMTGLSGYDAESALDADEQSADNIKQRKKENRNRRPISERWREAMDERARKTGQTVYRMREPDEETLEAAQEEMAADEAAWHGRIKDGADPAKTGSDDASGDLGALSDEPFSDEALADMPFLDEPGSSDEPVSMDFLPEEMLSDEPVSDEPVSDESVSDEPVSDESIAGDEFAALDFVETQSDDVAPSADESADLAEPAVADFTDTSEGESVVDEPAMVDDPDMPMDAPVVESEANAEKMTVEDSVIEDPTAENPMTVDFAELKADVPAPEDVAEPSDDAVAAQEMPEDGDAPVQVAEDTASKGKSGMMSGFWNKLRGPDKKAVADDMPADEEAAILDEMPADDDAAVPDDMPADEEAAILDEMPADDDAAILDEMPASDEASVSDDDMIFGDEPVAEDEPDKKSAAKKKKSAKRKSAKSGKS